MREPQATDLQGWLSEAPLLLQPGALCRVAQPYQHCRPLQLREAPQQWGLHPAPAQMHATDPALQQRQAARSSAVRPPFSLQPSHCVASRPLSASALWRLLNQLLLWQSQLCHRLVLNELLCWPCNFLLRLLWQFLCKLQLLL